MQIAGIEAKCIFDTGAQYGYVINDKLLAGGKEDGEFSDYNPIIGKMQSKAWLIEVELGGSTFTERVGQSPALLMF